MTASLMTSAPGTLIPAAPDFPRMRAERVARLRADMREQGVDALVLLANTNVVYATGSIWPLADAGRVSFERPVAVVFADEELPHLFSPIRLDDQMRAGLPTEHVHGPAHLDFDEGVELFFERLAALAPSGLESVAIDEWSHALRRFGRPFSDGARIINKAKAVKTPDELAAMREGLRITEQAMRQVQALVAPGVPQTKLTGTFLRAIFEAGADANVLDPIWQVMPSSIKLGPWTTTGDIACPLLSTERELQRGDVMWVDVALSHGGFHSDFGRTWIVGDEPSARQRAQFDRWRSIMDAVLGVTRAGATASQLTAAAIEANDGEKPWMPHFYLGHGLGIDAAETPFVGSDIGEVFDAQLHLEAGMVLVLEPIVWEDGHGGYRSEEVVVITESGWEPMTDYSYDPF